MTLTATVLPIRTRLISGQAMRLGIRTTNTGTTTAASVTSCLRLPQNLTEEEKRSVGIITESMRAELEGQVPQGEEPVAIEGSAQGVTVVETAPAEPAQPKAQTSLDVGLAQSAGLSVQLDQDGAICGSCGWTMVRSGSCYKCMNCGSTSGCS
jgi:hypothetical protein